MMNSDFIKDIEILLDCKKYVEKRLKTLKKRLNYTHSEDRAEILKAEITECEQVLGMVK